MECATGMGNVKRKNIVFPLEKYKQIIQEIHPHVVEIQLFLQGEPFLNANLEHYISFASHYNLFTTISTNGHFIDDKMAQKIVLAGLDKLIISIDGLDQKTYEKYRVNGDLKTVLNGVNAIVKAKKELRSKFPIIEIQFLIFKHNEHQIGDFKKRFKQKGIDLIAFKTAQIINPSEKEYLIPQNSRHSRYIKKNNSIQSKKTNKNRCFKIWHTSVITTDGDALACCYDKSGKNMFGNVFNTDFMSIWYGEKANSFRKAILMNQDEILICRNCDQ